MATKLCPRGNRIGNPLLAMYPSNAIQVWQTIWTGTAASVSSECFLGVSSSCYYSKMLTRFNFFLQVNHSGLKWHTGGTVAIFLGGR